VLRICSGHLDIHLQVLAMDSGLIGQQVRVCTLDRKTVFHAVVTGEATVTGAME
jgi:flagella basal body P-ring formation protein FlgA